MKVTAIMATCGRHYCSERSLSLFLNQKYVDKQLIIFQNSRIPQKLDASIDSSIVSLINNHIDYSTGKPYTSLGAIYTDTLKHVSDDTDIIIFWDDDDLFLEDHITEGVNGLIRGQKSAYKPAWSYFKSLNGLERAQNTLEPSIFIKAKHIKQFGFSKTTTDQHLNWLNPLLNSDDIYIDDNGKPTLVYNWGDLFYTYKTSGNVNNPDHFNEYRVYSDDHGDGVISKIDISAYLNNIESAI